jgi:methionine-rich copper-binding protein CopC
MATFNEFLSSAPQNVNIVGSAGDTINYVDFGGLDTYTIAPLLAGPVTISDNDASTIILPSGLTIDSVRFAANGVEFTVNGHLVTLIGNPDLFTFVFAGDALNPAAGVPRTLAETAAAFGATIPAEGQPPVSGTITGEINDSGDVGGGGAGSFTLTAAAPSFNEGSSMTYTVTAAAAVAADTTFSWSLSGTGANPADAADFSTATSGTVTILAGQTTATFAVGAVAGDGAEFAETFTVTLTDSASATVGTVTTTINDTSTADVTDPVVTAGQVFNYAENQAAGTVLATVLATDNVGVTGYAIATGNADGFFAIDNTGKITLTAAGAASKANDFEAAPNAWTLGITAIDAAGNVSDAVNVVLNETDVDDDRPVLSQAVITGATLTLTYNEALDPVNLPLPTDFSVVAGGSTSVNVNSVTISGSTVTLALASTPSGTVTVAYTPNSNPARVLQDLAGNDAAAFSGQTAVVDTTAPTLVSSSPADGATNVAVGDNIVLTMSETVKAGTGNIVITNSNDATDTRTIDVTSSQVTFSGSTVTINPTADLKTGGNYVVTIGSGVIKDIAGNSFAGISGTALDFSTPGTSSTGQTFTLTTAIDAIPGLKGSLGTTDNSGNDTIIGEFANSPANTLNAADQIDGGLGNDILKMYGTFTAAQMPVTIKNVETLDVVTAANAALDFSAYTKAASGVTQIMVENASAMNGKTITTTAGQSLSLATGPAGSALGWYRNLGGFCDRHHAQPELERLPGWHRCHADWSDGHRRFGANAEHQLHWCDQ